MTLGELIHYLLTKPEVAAFYSPGALFDAVLVLPDGNEIEAANISAEHPRREGDLYIYLSDGVNS